MVLLGFEVGADAAVTLARGVGCVIVAAERRGAGGGGAGAALGGAGAAAVARLAGAEDDAEAAAVAARCAVNRCVGSLDDVRVLDAIAGSGAGEPSNTLRTAVGESEIWIVENSRNAPGSGFGAASSRVSRSRICSSMIR